MSLPDYSSNNITVQYDLFRSKEECEKQARISAVEETCHKVRKKLFKDNNDLKKIVHDLSARLEILERNICQK